MTNLLQPKEYEVWMEGYWVEPECEGKPVPHQFIGRFKGLDFQDACRVAANTLADGKLYDFFKYYDRANNTWRGCRFFDNEKDASEAMDESKFNVDKAVDWFFDHYKDYGIECMPNHVGKIPDGADEITFNLLDAIKNQQLTNNKYETI